MSKYILSKDEFISELSNLILDINRKKNLFTS